MADKIAHANKGEKLGKKQRSRVSETAAKSNKLDRKLAPPSVLDPVRLALDRSRTGGRNADNNNAGRNSDAYVYPVSAQFTGHWNRPDPRDTKFDVMARAGERPAKTTDEKRIYESEEFNAVKGAITPWGLQLAPSDLPDYLIHKKQQEEALNVLQLGSYLVDPKRPETQERAFSIFPELKNEPEAYHAQNLALQEALRTMLRDGTIRGKEDNLLIFKIVQDDFMLPIHPAWDPNGLIMDEVYKTDAFWEWQKAGTIRGMLNPKKWSTEKQDGDKGYIQIQRKLKKMLLKRLYPAFREMPEDMMEKVMFNLSGVTGAPTSNDYNLKQWENVWSKFGGNLQPLEYTAP